MPSNRRPRLRLAALAVAALAASLIGLGATADTSLAAACDAPITNPVACENTKPGADPSTWQIDGAGDPTIQGFATSMSVNKGQTIGFKIKSATANYQIDILRLGYYAGKGAREVDSNLTPTNTAAQPPCETFADSGLVDCGDWSVSRTWTVPSTAVSGVYIAHLIRNDTGGESHITFVVRDDASTSDAVLQTSDATWQAYNTYGGNSLYKCTVACPEGNPDGYKAAYKVSYNRPFNTAEDDSGRSALFTGGEYPLIRFLEASGFNLSYMSSVDVHRRGNLLQNHRLFISSGHDEYWSATQRTAMEQARNAGVNLAFFTGNTGFWKTRWEPSADGASTQDRTLVSYKDTHFDVRQDPVEWTGTWRDPRFTTPAENVTPENALLGQSFLVNSGTSDIMVPQAFGQLRMWRNTAAASLPTGGSLRLAPETLGYEWDQDADNGFRPDGLIRLSSTTVSDLEVFTDYGSFVKTGATATHYMTMYKAPSGSRVFNTGTVQWSWGLDAENDAGNAVDRNMQQATLNVFADMGVQPFSILPNLVRATATTDTARPTSTINALPASVADGTQVTVTGTAADTGGGRVAGIEVSTDGGATWHPATSGTTSWSYTWTAHGNPNVTIKSRATDDSGNIETPGAGRSVGVSCPCSLWGNSVTPDRPDDGDPSPVEVGVKFKSDAYGSISGVRFYKSAANTGTHTGSLWSESGERLAQATFANESGSGWQTVTFANPVAVTPGTTYVASYYAPNGHYAATADYFYRAPSPGPNGGATVDSAPLHGIRNTGGTLNGVYRYGGASAFPTSSSRAANYWVDVVFSPIAGPGAVTNVSATEAGRTSADVSWTAPTTGGAPTSYKITPYVGATAQTPKTVNAPATSTTMTGLTTGTTYRFTVQAINPTGNGPESAQSNAVTPSQAVKPTSPLDVTAQPAGQSARVAWSPPGSDGDSPITGYTITPYVGATAQTPVQAAATATSAVVTGLTNGTGYTFRVTATNAVGTSTPSAASAEVVPQATLLEFGTPAVIENSDNNAVEVGMKFTADHDGAITGVRFYKGAGNLGTHVGSLWSAAGQKLADVTFANETASGWQSARFASPQQITAGTTYVVSYYAPRGRYSATSKGFNTGLDNGPLHAVANSTSVNGVYTYGATSTFPTSSYQGTNYWVDVMYAVPAPGQVTGVSAAEGGMTSATVSWTPPAGSVPVSNYRITPYVGSTAQAATTVSGSATSTSVGGLTSGTTYRFTVRAINANGDGPESAQSNPVTPAVAVTPPAPTAVSAEPASQAARVEWTPHASNGDSPITGFIVTPYIGAAAQTPIQVGASATSTVVTGLANGTDYTFTVAAKNDVGTGTASAASAAVSPRATIFDFASPAVADSGETRAIEVGVKFRSDFDGTITGLRFYKSAANTGTHVGSLWSASGQRLRFATFASETDSGWQSVTFDQPVAVTAGTTYIASYNAPKGRYSVTSNAFASAVDNGRLQALANSTSANGVFAYGAAGTFPTGSFNATNYWVDVLYAPAGGAGQVTGVQATAGQASASVSWTAPATGGAPTSYVVTPYIGATAQTPKTVTGTPPATSTTVSGLTPGTAYTFTVRASNPGGDGPVSAPSAPVTPLGAGAPGAPTGVSAEADVESANVSWTAPTDDGGSAITGYTVTPFDGATALTPVPVGPTLRSTRVTGLTVGTAYTFTVKATNGSSTGPASGATNAVTPQASIFDFATPAILDGNDKKATVLGVKFRSDVAGSVTGIRFYKAATNTGTHIGTLWSATGQNLRQATFTNETASGWQTVRFATPMAIDPDTTYVASYLAPVGRYSVNSAAFTTNPVDNPPLHALSTPTSPNGVYAYATTPTFPTGSFNSTNYWVDVLFAPGG